MHTNYFVCTLGQASQHETPFPTVCGLISEQAENNPDLPAVGFYNVPSSRDLAHIEPEILTFREIQRGILVFAARLSSLLQDQSTGQAVALLCCSSPEFLFTWLALIWLQHPVLIIAPDLTSSSIAHLCKDCSATTILADEKNETLATKATTVSTEDTAHHLRCCRIPDMGSNLFHAIKTAPYSNCPPPRPKTVDVAYFHHTSGTSSGSPKPVPQSHHGAVGAVPCIDGKDRAIFTTTPLYHGGPADIFRAWTSNAMIWLFPSQDVPVIPANVIKCLRCARSAFHDSSCPRIKFFASVPYVLEGLAGDEEGLQWLQEMDLVGVGGASLSEEIGSSMVIKGVNLVSRFGSAECGFMLSSHRDYERDSAWQYLRMPATVPNLRLELHESGLYELVVLEAWPHKAKSNREDGSYATSDLFEAHPELPGAWKYHSRADAQLTLVTGKKLDPEAVEKAIAEAIPEVSEAFVFGSGQTHPGVLLARSKEGAAMSDDQIAQNALPVVQEVNDSNPKQAKIPSNMLIPVPHSNVPFPKSSKGTVLRKQTEHCYNHEIEGAYEKPEDETGEFISDEQLATVIKDIVCDNLNVTPRFDVDTDLFSLGIDSVAGIQIRQRLQSLAPKSTGQLPSNIVEECGTIRSLAEYILSLRNGKTAKHEPSVENDGAYMRKLVAEFSRFRTQPSGHVAPRNEMDDSNEECVILTGATGALGAHVLDELSRCHAVKKIFCLTRRAQDHSVRARVTKALQKRRLSTACLEDDENVVVLEASLGDHNLGLPESRYLELVRNATIILHVAWSVNFRVKLRSFAADNIAGVRNLINLALSSTHQAKFVFCSSVASVMSLNRAEVPEEIINDTASAGTLGYSQSKWVAEQICHHAAQEDGMNGRVSILRVGQLAGDSTTGIWNAKEAWPILLSTVELTGSLPDLPGQVIDWLPVDVAAKAVIEATISPRSHVPISVLHIVNVASKPSWAELLQWLREKRSLSVLPVAVWLDQLEKGTQAVCDHPATHLIDHWKQLYLHESGKRSPVTFEMEMTKSKIQSLQKGFVVDEEYFSKIWTWVEREVLSSTKAGEVRN